mmetsp:Transcript_15915/g.18441  ORF Transcript_15915/g.18441 Transcript_15915/m.18441 type:complete len:113 (-) Transcript_15915:3-341(-)
MPLHTLIKITPHTYGFQEEIFSFDTEADSVTSFPSLQDLLLKKSGQEDSTVNLMKTKKQKLSFDDADLSAANKEFGEISKLGKKTYSSNDIVEMQEKLVKKKGLKKSAKFVN